MNWMVKTMPTKAAVRRQTPRERGPTMSSCSIVFFQWTLPVGKRIRECDGVVRLGVEQRVLLGVWAARPAARRCSPMDLACRECGQQEGLDVIVPDVAAEAHDEMLLVPGMQRTSMAKAGQHT